MSHERVDGLLRGAVGGAAGVAAMGLFFRAAQAFAHGNSQSDGEATEDFIERRDELDDISVAGPRSRDDEPATETVARVAYEAVADEEPDEEIRRKLGHAVHWSYGILLGAVYGAVRTSAHEPDLLGGLGYGTAAWAIGDELVVAMLGLAEGPTAHPWTAHAKALGAHLVYGAATSTATQALRRVM